MPFVSGYLRVRESGHPDHELPEGEGPVDPGYGIGEGLRPGHDLPVPVPPPGIWPPPSLGNPIAPVHPDNTLPVQPGTIWPPPGRPNRPDNSLPGGGPIDPGYGQGGGERPDNSLPSGGNRPDNSLPSQTFWMLCYCPTLGWKYIAVDPSLSIGGGPAPTPEPKE
jgi:hypothetical protein